MMLTKITVVFSLWIICIVLVVENVNGLLAQVGCIMASFVAGTAYLERAINKDS